MTRADERSSSVLFAIDEEFCKRASDELTQILECQDRKFASHFEVFQDATFRVKFLRAGRLLCVALAILGFAICALSLAIDSYGMWRRPEVPFMALFAALGFFSWLVLPGLSERLYHRATGLRQRVQAWSTLRSAVSCRKTAERILKVARSLVPYDAHYVIRGSTLQSSRSKNGRSDVAWKRDLIKYKTKGLSVSGPSVTIVFRRPGSFVPAACILHHDPEWIRDALRRFEIPVRILRPDPRAEACSPDPATRSTPSSVG